MLNEMPLQFYVIGNPENRRIEFFQAALRRFNLPPAKVLCYLEALSHPAGLPVDLPVGTVLRIESPGENFEVEKAFLLAGFEAAVQERSPAIAPDAIRALQFDRGLIFYPRQWYLGFCRWLELLAVRVSAMPGVMFLNRPDDIAVMFDKAICHARCKQAEVPVPDAIGPVCCYDELMSRMDAAGLSRVFVKLANGSSASGVVAFSHIRKRPMAITTAEMVTSGGETRLYNSLKIRCYRDSATIAQLIDSLCRERVHVEAWLPKASLGEGELDLRIVVIDGQPKHVVARQGRSPMTNLHLGNRRGNAALVRERMGEDRWHAIEQTCRQTAAIFPRTLHAGLDILITPGWRRHAVLEVNAFGDLLPNILCDGQDTYSAEVAAVLERSNGCTQSEILL